MAAYSSKHQEIPEGYDIFAVNQYTPEQEKLFGRNYKQIGKGSYLERLAGGEESAYGETEGQAYKQFGGLQSGIGSRFGGGMSSGQGQNQASKNFALNLRAGRHGMRQQAILDLMGLSNQFLQQRPQERGLAESGEEHYGSLDQFARDYQSNKRKYGNIRL
jgi:hypothetical protein